MTVPLHIHTRIEQLRREIVEISATRNVRHHSGPEKVKNDRRIQRLWEIKNELSALIAKRLAGGNLACECQRE